VSANRPESGEILNELSVEEEEKGEGDGAATPRPGAATEGGEGEDDGETGGEGGKGS